jgi:hypothetical protein
MFDARIAKIARDINVKTLTKAKLMKVHIDKGILPKGIYNELVYFAKVKIE